MDIKAPAINYFDHIEHYWRIIEAGNKSPGPGLNKLREPMLLLLESLLSCNTATGLCHHDPVIANFVGTPERLYLIDWEYASYGLQIMDYAALAHEWQLDDSVVSQHTAIEPGLLMMAKELYKYLCLLWNEAIT
jgi:thiamine kinase-like enzyme